MDGRGAAAGCSCRGADIVCCITVASRRRFLPLSSAACTALRLRDTFETPLRCAVDLTNAFLPRVQTPWGTRRLT
ncbi:hypothetical protein MRX96_042408 [Rhipicephalus microplus]